MKSGEKTEKFHKYIKELRLELFSDYITKDHDYIKNLEKIENKYKTIIDNYSKIFDEILKENNKEEKINYLINIELDQIYETFNLEENKRLIFKESLDKSFEVGQMTKPSKEDYKIEDIEYIKNNLLQKYNKNTVNKELLFPEVINTRNEFDILLKKVTADDNDDNERQLNKFLSIILSSTDNNLKGGTNNIATITTEELQNIEDVRKIFELWENRPKNVAWSLKKLDTQIVDKYKGNRDMLIKQILGYRLKVKIRTVKNDLLKKKNKHSVKRMTSWPIHCKLR